VRNFIEAIWDEYMARSGKSWLVEKTPAHAFHILDILRVFPEARFIHLVRDGRDVAASIAHAGRTWNPGWPTEIGRAAAMWRRYNQAILAAWSAMRGETLFVMRYEDLLEEPARKLTELFTFVGVQQLNDKCLEDLVAAHTFEAYRQAAHSDFDRLFFRQGRCGDWRQIFSAQDIIDFKAQAGELLLKFGYEDTNDWD
jgi:hypothetical protein